MQYEQYKAKFPLTKFEYSKSDVEKIRKHSWDYINPAKKMTRSQKQNAYYWAVVCKTLSSDTGYTSDEIHQLLAQKFLSYEKKGKTFVASTTTLKTGEFEGYMEDCRRFASTELSCFIPLPNETDFDWSKK